MLGTYAQLDSGRGNYETKITKVKPTGNLLELIRAGAHLTKVPLTIDKCDWKVEVKLDAYCLGDVIREARAAIDLFIRTHVFTFGPMPFVAVDMAPWRFNDKYKGHAFLAFGVKMDTYADMLLQLADKDSGYGKLKYFGVDESDTANKRVYIKAEASRAAFGSPIIEAEIKTLFMGGFDRGEFDDKLNGVAMKAVKGWLIQEGMEKDIDLVMKDAFVERAFNNDQIHKVRFEPRCYTRPAERTPREGVVGRSRQGAQKR